MSYGAIRVGGDPTESKPYVVKAVGGFFGGQSKGPYSADELVRLYDQHKSKLGGMLVKSVEVYRLGKLFFVAPRDGGPSEFKTRDIRAKAAPKLPADGDPGIVPPSHDDVEPAPQEESHKLRNIGLGVGAGLLLLLGLRR